MYPHQKAMEMKYVNSTTHYKIAYPKATQKNALTERRCVDKCRIDKEKIYFIRETENDL